MSSKAGRPKQEIEARKVHLCSPTWAAVRDAVNLFYARWINMRTICITSGDVGSGSPPVTAGEADTVGVLAVASVLVEAWIAGVANAVRVRMRTAAILRARFLNIQSLLWQRKYALCRE